MGILQKIFKVIANASMPTYKFENNKLSFKLDSEDYFEYDLKNYDIKTRHDPFVLEAYTLNNDEIFLEYIKTDSSTSWNGQALSFYENFFKEKLQIRDFDTIENKEINNYVFKVKKIDEAFVLHIVYIWGANTDIIIVDMKGDLYKSLLTKLDSKYNYKFEEEEKGTVNFNISLVKENCLQGFFNGSN